MTSPTPPTRLSGRAKAFVDYGPLLVFFVAYFFGARLAPVFGRTIAPGEELFVSVALFLPAFAIAFAYSVWRERRIAPMLLVSGLAVADRVHDVLLLASLHQKFPNHGAGLVQAPVSSCLKL